MAFSKISFIQLILILALVLLSLNAYSVYKWKDANGNIQYTEYPPPTGDVEIMKPPPISTIGTQKSELAPDNEDKNKDKGETKPKEKKQATIDPKAEQEMKQKNCETAKKNLATYLRTKKIRDKEGNVVRISDDDWQNRVNKTRQKIEEFCN